MNKQKGISQIWIMVIMLVLAIALPITTNLVKKSQENRSKATGGLGYAEVCTGDASCKLPSDQNSGFCTDTTHLVNWKSFDKGAPPVCSYGWGNPSDTRRNQACISIGGSCTEAYATPWGNDCKTDKNVDGTVVWNLCLADPYLNTARCCVPDSVYVQLGDADKTTVVSKPSDGLACKKGSVTWIDEQATDGTYNWKCVGYEGKVSIEGIATKQVCTSSQTRCTNGNLETCTDNRWGGSTPCGTGKQCNTTGTACVDNTCVIGEKKCNLTSGNLDICNSTLSGWVQNQDCGVLGCDSTNKRCNECLSGKQKCTATNKYFTCTSGQWTTTTTNCSDGEVCINTNEGPDVCTTPDYVPPKLNLFFAISGVKAVNPCFGNLKFRVYVIKDGQKVTDIGVINREVTATVVTDRFSDYLEDQVFKISNFELGNSYLLADKIKIAIYSSRKTLATVYGKNNQNAGFPALSASQILVSSLGDNITLDLSAYPILNGDIGKDGQIGIQDGVINGSDFGHMKNQWEKTCSNGQNLESDLNGDCIVDSSDLQILKNGNNQQYAQVNFLEIN